MKKIKSQGGTKYMKIIVRSLIIIGKIVGGFIIWLANMIEEKR